MEVEIRDVPASRIAAWPYEGPYGGLAAVVRGATAWLRAHKEPGGALVTVFLDAESLLPSAASHIGDAGVERTEHAHEEGHSVRCEVWVPLSPRFEVPDAGPEHGPEVREVPAARMAVVEREGDPRDLLALAVALRRFLAAEGYRLAGETRIVHQMPSWEEFAAWRAEVQVPIKIA